MIMQLSCGFAALNAVVMLAACNTKRPANLYIGTYDPEPNSAMNKQFTVTFPPGARVRPSTNIGYLTNQLLVYF